MKKLWILALMSFALVNCNAQENKEKKSINVPEAAKQAFVKQFPAATKTDWSLEKVGEYEVEFKLNKMEMSALYDTNGNLLETETEIDTEQLPAGVQSILTSDFNGYKAGEISKVEAKGTTSYEMEVEKGEATWELTFDANGNLLKKVQEKEKGDEQD